MNLAGTPALGGNVVLWKPSDGAMLSGWLVYKILMESGLPEGIICNLHEVVLAESKAGFFIF